MEITGLDFIKRSDDKEEEIRVTGLDFAVKKEECKEPASVEGLVFISRRDDERAGETEDHGVTGLDFIKHSRRCFGHNRS